MNQIQPQKTEVKTYYSILQWIVEEGIVNEKGEAFDFYDRPWLLDVLADWTPWIVLMACAQVGKSVTFSIKSLFAVKYLRFNAIYTMSSQDDVSKFVKTKMNPIIVANHHEFVGMDSDSIELKQLNKRFLLFQGTNSTTAGVSDTADVLIHDEISRSDQIVIERFKSRTKASLYKGRWMFSNPGTERDELHLAHIKSDQKEWCITCPSCKEEDYMTFPESVDIDAKCYICKHCKEPLPMGKDDVRRKGRWVAQQPGSKISGYHLSHLMCPWITAEEVIEDSMGDPEYFNNFVLGLPYSPGDLSVTKTTILDLWTPKELDDGVRYIGIDVGNIKHYVVRTKKGILKIGRFTNWSELDDIIKLWRPVAGVIDAMPDSTASKYYTETYDWMKMSYFMENNNNPQTIIWWGEGDKKSIVYSHRDRALDRFLTDIIEAKWLIGAKPDKDFALYIKHFETLRRTKVTNNKGIERYVWESTTGEDHFVFADYYSTLAMEGEGAGVFFAETEEKESVLGADNVYDVSKAFNDNNQGYAEDYGNH